MESSNGLRLRNFISNQNAFVFIISKRYYGYAVGKDWQNAKQDSLLPSISFQARIRRFEECLFRIPCKESLSWMVDKEIVDDEAPFVWFQWSESFDLRKDRRVCSSELINAPISSQSKGNRVPVR